MGKSKRVSPTRSNDKIRQLMLEYFYERNNTATSRTGKRGSAARISDIKRDLKAAHGLKQQEVQSNLTYLISQGWVEVLQQAKQFTSKSGTVIPSVTPYYEITAEGIDKIEGPGEFTMRKFNDIKIEATGQNIITVGDGNQVNAQFSDLGQVLAELRGAVTSSEASEADKMGYVADIETIQTQLAKPEPNRTIIGEAWKTLKGVSTISGCVALYEKVVPIIAPLLQ